MTSHPTCSVALVGTGMVAHTHLLALADLTDTIRLKGIFSHTAPKAETFAKEASRLCATEVITYSDISALCADKDVAWVIVLTPPNARLEIVKMLAASGKSILMEKPIERTLEAATQIVKICEDAKVHLGIVFQHRARAASRHLSSLIEKKALGSLCIAEITVPWWRDQSYYDEPGRGTFARDGGGVLISQAIHTLDLMLSLTGRVTEVQALAHTTALHDMEAEDYVTAGLRFANGAVGTLTASTANFPGQAESITLHFTKCVASLHSGQLHLQWRDGRTESFGTSTTTGAGADPMAFTHDWHRDIIANFQESVQQNHAPLIPGRQALEVHALIEAILTSSHIKRAVAVPYLER